MTNFFDHVISEEMFAAWLDGNLSDYDQQFVEQQLMDNPQMQELLVANEQVEEYYDEMVINGCDMPEELMLDFDLQPIGGIEDYENYSDDEIEDYPDDSVEMTKEYQVHQEELDPLQNEGDFESSALAEDDDETEVMDLDPSF